MKRRHFLAASALPVLGCKQAQVMEGKFLGVSHERGHALASFGATQPRVWPEPSVTRRTRVIIAGAGVAGLAAARALRLRGSNDFTVLELEDSAGGNSRGDEIHGIPCPLGAHYLPLPSDSAPDLQDLLEEFSLRRRVAGRWQYDERHLCHSPQERLFINGHWQEGLLPLQGVDAQTLAQYQQFARRVRELSTSVKFTMPVAGMSLHRLHLALDAITFEAWLEQHQLGSPFLRWYLDYCCRDDYGAGLASVSAWAGIHYFASRHGFHAPGAEPLAERDAGLLTWPQGNAWLTQRLAEPLGERLLTGRVVIRVALSKHGVEVDAFNTGTHAVERWHAEHCVMALPLFVAARVVENPPPALHQAVAALRYAPWLVANLHIKTALLDRPGAAPSWDNVIYSGNGSNFPGLGYVDAMHQSLQPVAGATVLTYYRAFGISAGQRRFLLEQPWAHWRDAILAELSQPHPDLSSKVTRMDVMRYGHAMSTPVPGIRSNAALLALQNPQQSPWQRLHFAHSDLSGYSVFEEAFTHGHRRGMGVAN